MNDKCEVIAWLANIKEKYIHGGDEEFDECRRESIDMAIKALRQLKEQETKTGHWIDTTKVIGFPRVQCSVCGSGQGAIWMNYCPNCGAKMEGR